MEKSVLEEYVNKHYTLREIAEEVDRSTTTVRYWLKKYGLRTYYSRKADEPKELYIDRMCRVHGWVSWKLNSENRYRCPQCNVEAVRKRRNTMKELLIEYKGGKCERCGYSGAPSVLEFHHLDPDKKDFTIAAKGHTRSLERNKEEVDKCMMLCANCHREKHAGVW